ncbi:MULTISPECIES: hypothetical protein [Pseudomonas]|uniref:hypothetical protein n=1 Tax=Pseudomonas TaxID=286 RepID=UPI0013E02B86|nr:MULTISPECIES: hypothetical protein [Pseudomonas]MCE0909442.1 hypothetical protein [Pseudomonas kurunegalensis]QIG19146.1 hypothetical protein FY041_15975 [Pseudomonas monteilii]QIG24401.1 hypothetical protein FY043_15970 [Pseudomonas monteilii]WJR53814.1 hypothetical protein LU664_015615 [Pseudomonas kurunegalensis]
MNQPHGTLATLAMTATLFSLAAQAGTYPDYGYAPPDSYKGPTFTLSQSYPTSPPNGVPAFFAKLPDKRDNNFETWRPYMEAAKRYCLEGNVEADWYVQHNRIRQWYHMPWQHYGPLGREGIHGLTKEAQIQVKQLASTQTATGQTYAVGIYNDIGAYTLGQVWKDPNNPDPSHTAQPNSFTNGTVVCKALFADIDRSTVPFLANPVLWQGYITDTFTSANRKLKDVALIQMDVAVRDTRIAETGWIFGTFQYNGAMSGKASWDNLVPVGVMWGNDPQVTGNEHTNPEPTQTRINKALQQTAINANTRELPPTHLGWNGRLNGPVDNPNSSCLSCHATAEAPQVAIMNPLFQSNPPSPGSDEWMKWFQNIPAGHAFTPGTQSTDYSLQMSGGMVNFYQWKCDMSGIYADGRNACAKVASMKLKMATPGSAAQQQPVQRVIRDPSLEQLLE